MNAFDAGSVWVTLQQVAMTYLLPVACLHSQKEVGTQIALFSSFQTYFYAIASQSFTKKSITFWFQQARIVTLYEGHSEHVLAVKMACSKTAVHTATGLQLKNPAQKKNT